ncbi:Rpn family recombination-promoting nuclease/putative transposase [Pantoea sp.]|uniref:Rpn family recombination-promoting nuclease/putative transposase n=1 Tax=Pantoea sp. TaxID=69393 RepID=UPI0028AF6C59|nr:Rpn family recombination-promoting nuclease/putative transposase [Pantoea sp.]
MPGSAEVIDLLVSALQADESSSQTLSLVNYIIQAGETTDAGAFVRELAQRMPQQEDALMTIAEQLKQEGRKEGKREGMLEGKREVARSLLKMKLPREAILQATGLKEEDLARISVN